MLTLLIVSSILRLAAQLLLASGVAYQWNQADGSTSGRVELGGQVGGRAFGR